MKMARASDADIDAATEICGILESLERNMLPKCCQRDPDRGIDRFRVEDLEECQRVIEAILGASRKGSISRVVRGMRYLLDPRRELLDPDADALELHPMIVRALERAAVPENDDPLQRDAFEREYVAEFARSGWACSTLEQIREYRAGDNYSPESLDGSWLGWKLALRFVREGKNG